MKRKINSKLTIMSAAAAALTMISLLSGCSSKKDVDGDLSGTPAKGTDTPKQTEMNVDTTAPAVEGAGNTSKNAVTNASKNTATTAVKKSDDTSNEADVADQFDFGGSVDGSTGNGNASGEVNDGYDQQAYENLGIKVYLHGTNEEQAQQWADALNEAYPNLNMTCNGTGAGPDIAGKEEMWDLSEEEVDAKIIDALGGKDWHDCNIGELANAMPWAGRTQLGSEISNYFYDQTYRAFNWGDYHIIG